MKYIRLFETVEGYDSNFVNLEAPNISYVKNINGKYDGGIRRVEYFDNNKIFYTSTDGNIVTPYVSNAFGANIISNTYENGVGIITFDADVTSIGDSAFHQCQSLTSIRIPDSVTSIGEGAFWNCSSLTSVTIGNSVTSIGEGAFSSCDSLTSVTIPYSVTSIGRGAFEYCYSLTSVTIPDSVTSIGRGAFEYCYSLTSVTIPDSVTSIREYAFRFCSSLISITIPNSVTSIGEGAFENCNSLTSITIPDSITSIGSFAFYDCSSLTSVYCKRTTPPTGGSYMFNNDVSGRKIYVPYFNTSAYKSATNWSSYADDIEGYNFWR